MDTPDWLIWDLKKHFRIHHGKNRFVRGQTHMNGINNFRGYAKNRLSKFRDINNNSFYLNLKECEFRFNYRHENIYQMIRNCGYKTAEKSTALYGFAMLVVKSN
jgi:hypothetical protein